MRLLVWLAVGTASALLAGTATAGLLPPPPSLPPAPTVTLPPPPVPVPPLPPLPAPTTTTTSTAPAPAPAPAVVTQAVSTVTSALSPTSPATATSVSSAASSLTAGTSSSSPSAASPSSGSVGTASSAGARSSSGPRAEHVHSSRTWIGTTGPRRRRTTTITFVLGKAGRVVLTVNQVAPVCVGIGHFTVRGRAGLNRVRVGGAVHGRPLTAGTYHISIRTAGGHLARRVTLVVVDGAAPSRDELRTLQSANTCSSGAATTTTSSSSSMPPTSQANGPDTPASQQGSAQAVVPPAPSLHGILGSSIAKTARAVRPLLVALLGLAIVLLGVASLPRAAVPGPRMHDLLARHRIEVAGLGVAALLAVALELLWA